MPDAQTRAEIAKAVQTYVNGMCQKVASGHA